LKEGEIVEIFKLFGSIFVDNEKANKAIDETDEKAEKTSGTFGKMGGAAAALGGVLGGAIVAGAGAAVAGLGGLFVMGDNLQKSLNGLQAQTGATEEEMKGMEESLKTIYKNGYGESFQEIADTMAIAKNTTSAWGEDLQWLSQDALMLRDTFGFEVNESLRSSDKLMKQFGLTGTDAMALIAEGSQKGLNFADDLLPTIDEYSVYFKQAGLDASDMFGMFQNAKNAGVFNLDYAADAFKEFGIIMTEDGTKASDALARIGVKNGAELKKQFAAGGDSAKEAFKTIAGALEGVEDPLLQTQIGVELFGTKFEDMGAAAVVAMTQTNDSIAGSVDVLNSINEIKYDSFGEALSGIGRNLMMGVFEPFQEKVMPIVNQFANWMAEKMPVVEEITNRVFTSIFDTVGIVWAFFKDNILPIFTEMFNNVQSNWPVIKETISTVFNAVWEVAKTVWAFFKDNILPIFVSLYEWISGHMPTIRATVETVFNKITEVVSKVWAFFKDNILPILQRLFEFIQSKMPQIQSIVETVFRIIKDVVKTVWDIFENFLLPVLKALWDWISPHIPKIQKAIETGFNAIFDVIESVVGVFEKVTGAIQKAVDWLGKWNDKPSKKKTVEIEERRTTSGNQIPGNATGTGYFQGGLSLVGERGPELVELPRGSKINPANVTRNKLGKQETKQPTIIQIVTPDKRKLAEWLVDDITDFQEFSLARKSAFEG
jgi:phage-related minor tail protein